MDLAKHLITRTPRMRPMTSARGNVTKTEVEIDIAATSLHVIGRGTELNPIGGTVIENKKTIQMACS